jgi:hypothetical protein
MSTSHIPIYYDNHLVGSITLAEFMNQPRYGGRSAWDVISMTKRELASHLVGICPTAYVHPRTTKSELISAVLHNYWINQGKIAWERDALDEIISANLHK